MFSQIYLISTSLVLAKLVLSVEGKIIKLNSICSVRTERVVFSLKKVSTLIGNNLMKFEIDKS